MKDTNDLREWTISRIDYLEEKLFAVGINEEEAEELEALSRIVNENSREYRIYQI
jgi:hypothetical protein